MTPMAMAMLPGIISAAWPSIPGCSDSCTGQPHTYIYSVQRRLSVTRNTHYIYTQQKLTGFGRVLVFVQYFLQCANILLSHSVE